jgi:hypothetical protein
MLQVRAEMARLRDVRERGWADRLLEWRQIGLRLEAAISRCRYFVQALPFEVVAWAETRDDAAGRYRVEIGTFATEALARAACERDAERRLRHEGHGLAREVDIRIAPPRRRRDVGG